MQILDTVKVKFYNIFCNGARGRAKDEISYKRLYEAGSAKLSSELCLINILQTLQKLKAAVSIIIDKRVSSGDLECFKNIQDIYFDHATIFVDKKVIASHEQNKSVFMKFLETDMREQFKN